MPSKIFTEGIPQNCIITLKNIYFILLLACFGNLSISAQWVNNPSVNKAFSSNTTHYEIDPVLVRDGSNGAIVILQDVNTTNLYAQKITANGLVAWGDSTQPVLIRSGASMHLKHTAISDGAGGAYIAWIDYRDDIDGILGEIYMQHINAAGTLLWALNGIRITATIERDEKDVFMCSDGGTGVIVAWNWEDYLTNKTVSAQRVNTSGVVQWAPNGVIVADGGGFRWASTVVPDGNNGAIFLLTDTRNIPNGNNYLFLFGQSNPDPLINLDLYAQRLNGTGTALWGALGVPVCTAPYRQNTDAAEGVIPTFDGGAIFVYNDGRNNPSNNGKFDIYAQKVDANGGALWASNGIDVANTVENENITSVIPNGTGGAVVAWKNESNFRLMMQNINNAGAKSWLSTGIFVTPITDIVNTAKLVLDSNQQYVCVYESFNSIVSVQAQKLDVNGNLLWNPAGVSVANNSNSTPSALTVVLSEDTSIIATWEDFRNPTTDLYSSKLLADGTLAGAVLPNYISIANGNWSNPAIWNNNSVPPLNANVTIRHIVNVNVNATVNSLEIELPGGQLTILSGNNFTVVN